MELATLPARDSKPGQLLLMKGTNHAKDHGRSKIDKILKALALTQEKSSEKSR
jgi:hypothetical protein